MGSHDLQQMAEQLRELALPPLSPARYAECLECYEARSDQRRRLVEWATRHLVPELPRGVARVLSIGCGGGAFDRPVLAAVMSHAERVRYVGVDPSPQQCATFRATLGAVPGNNAEIGVHAATMQEADPTGAFDLVHLTHSLYYMPEPQRALRSALRRLAPGGRLAVLIAPNEELNALADACWRWQRGGRGAWFSDDVAAFFAAEGVAFEHARIEAWLDAGPLLAPGGLDDPEGRRLLDFIVQLDTRRLPEQLPPKLRAFVQSIAVEDGGRRWLAHPVEVIVASRA